VGDPSGEAPKSCQNKECDGDRKNPLMGGKGVRTQRYHKGKNGGGGLRRKGLIERQKLGKMVCNTFLRGQTNRGGGLGTFPGWQRLRLTGLDPQTVGVSRGGG